ncbi:MAG: amidohydrolase family protein, partial [Pseudolabrys sp.]
ARPRHFCCGGPTTSSANVRLCRGHVEYYCEHFWLTTSGAFSNSALICSIAEMGVERIMFSIDWPFMSNRAGRKWMDAAPVSDHVRTLILGDNARKLLKLS